MDHWEAVMTLLHPPTRRIFWCICLAAWLVPSPLGELTHCTFRRLLHAVAVVLYTQVRSTLVC